MKKKTPLPFTPMNPGERSFEILSHFWCMRCKKWWSIGDAPRSKKRWFCPWCGTQVEYKAVKSKVA